MKIWIVAVLVVIVVTVTGVACGAGESPAETPTPTESSTPTPLTPTATPSPTPTPPPTPTATPTPSLTPTATPEPSRGDYCGRLNAARENLRRTETTDASMELNDLASEIRSGLAERAWKNLDNDPARRDVIVSELARKIRLARRIIDIDPPPSLDFLHHEVAVAADLYIEVTEAMEISFGSSNDFVREIARNIFLSQVRDQIAASRMIDNPRCPY